MVVLSFKLKLGALNGEKVFEIRKCHCLHLDKFRGEWSISLTTLLY